jgi:O-antigen ligase
MNVFAPHGLVSHQPRAIRRGATALGALGVAALLGAAVASTFANTGQPSSPLAVAGGLALLGALALALARYDAAVALGMIIFAVVFIEPAPPDAVLMTVLAVAIVTGRFSLRRTPSPMLVLLGAFLVLNLVSAVFAIVPHRAASYMLISTYLCTFAVWLTSYVDAPERARKIVAPLIGGAVATTALGVAVILIAFPGRSLVDLTDGFRARGFFKDPNVFGPFCTFAALIVISEVLEPRLLKSRRPLKLLFLAVLVLGLLFSYSRAAWLNAGIAAATMIAAYSLRRGGGRKAAAMLATLVLLAGVGSIALAATGSIGFLDSRAHLQSYDTQRFSAQDRGLELAQSYPLGIGPGQFERTVGIASHNTYVRVLAEQGVLGLFVVLALLLATLGLAARNVVLGKDTYGVASVPLLASLCGILANSAFVDTLHWRHLWLVIGLIWAGAMRPPAENPS